VEPIPEQKFERDLMRYDGRVYDTDR